MQIIFKNIKLACAEGKRFQNLQNISFESIIGITSKLPYSWISLYDYYPIFIFLFRKTYRAKDEENRHKSIRRLVCFPCICLFIRQTTINVLENNRYRNSVRSFEESKRDLSTRRPSTHKAMTDSFKAKGRKFLGSWDGEPASYVRCKHSWDSAKRGILVAPSSSSSAMNRRR